MHGDSPTLSEQAASILRQFVESGGTDLFYRDWGQGEFTLQVDNLCQIAVSEPRFIQEDLKQLRASGLLAAEHASDGNLIYHVTRKSAQFIRATGIPTQQKTSANAERLAVDLHSGQSFGQWVLRECIGEGGNGVVWSANDSNSRNVALKFLKSEFIGKQREKRFRDEIEFLRRESVRSGILPLIDFGLPGKEGASEGLWFSTPFAQCFTKLGLAGDQNLEKLIAYMQNIAQTLTMLHDEQKWHRDLKPDNLFLLKDVPVIGDFGLVDYPEKAANTQEYENLGSRNYTAPELEGHAADIPAGPADVYSLAKTLWVLATGRHHPPPGHLRMDTAELRLSHICKHPKSLALDHLVERATAHSPIERPTMRDFAKELSEWLSPPVDVANTISPVLSNEHKTIFEVESRTRRDRERFISEAIAALRSFEPVLQDVAQQVRTRTLVDAYVGNAFNLEGVEFKDGYGGPRLVWKAAREVKVTIGDAWAAHLQSFVQVEAIEDGTMRIVAGHFVERTVHGEGLAGGPKRVWTKELRAPHGSAELENALALVRAELLNNCAVAIQKFAEEVQTLKPER